MVNSLTEEEKELFESLKNEQMEVEDNDYDLDDNSSDKIWLRKSESIINVFSKCI